MSVIAPTSYSLFQKALHWTMALLILFNLIFSDAMEEAVEAYERGEVPSPADLSSANIHAYVGIAVLCLGLIRLAVRLTRGAPAAPAEEPPVLRLASKIAHGTFYALFILLPLSGIGKYYFGNEIAGELHGGPLKLLMWVLIVVHIAAVLVHQFYWKTPVAQRMTKG
ncbi:cytochrome b [Rhizobium sp. AAP43]|uniref:cytochrome b n=1 Tax=Rhizobium sp. AAP43 TaxID=1523420 RepID=UPI0006B94C3A|nr:cytochrome b/b6 domain-containing protein [Rhizobium sp. AAP43]KPF44991.1 cytochrome B [Rhizobium sp. AAP43]